MFLRVGGVWYLCFFGGTQPFLFFVFWRRVIFPRPQGLAPFSPRPRALLRRPLLRPPRSLLPQSRRLPRRFPLFQRLQELRHSRPPRPLPPQLRRRLRRSDSPPDKSCPPSSRRCPESPSTAPASSHRASPHC